jgi:sec-independent protein translocase protein TatB
MLPEIGISELLVIGVIALIVVGPKDLPILMRRVGGWIARLRGMAADFRSSFDEMARQSELDELRQEVEAMRRGDFGNSGSTLSDTQADINATMSEINSRLKSGEMSIYPPMAGSATSSMMPQLEPEAVSEVSVEAEVAPKPKRVRKAKVPETMMEPATGEAVADEIKKVRRTSRKVSKA